MEDWFETTLNKFIDVESGFAFKSEGFVTKGIPVVKIGNISNYTTVETNDNSFIKEEDLFLYKDYILHEGDILIAMSGNTTCKMGRVSTEFSPSLVNQRVGWIKPKSEEIDINFVYYLLTSNTYQNRLWNFATATGQPNLSPRDIKRISFFKPPKLEQTIIAYILSKVDEAIRATENTIKAADKLKRCLMQNLLTGKLKVDGTWRKEDEFEMTKIGLIPKDWQIKTVKELSSQVTDGEHTTPERSDKGFYLLSARNIKNGYLDLSDVDFVPEKELRKIQKRCNPQSGDILISCSGTIGNVCIVPDGLDAGMVRSAALIKLKKEEFESEFAEFVFQSFSLQNQMKVSVASSVQGNIFQDAIKKLRIPYPPNKKERDTLTKHIRAISETVIKKQSKIVILKRLKKSLMQNLLTGRQKVDVNMIEEVLNSDLK